MYRKFLGLSAAFGLAATVGLASYAQYFPPSGGGGTGPTTNPVSLAQGGTGVSLTGGGSTGLFFSQAGTFIAPPGSSIATDTTQGVIPALTNAQIVIGKTGSNVQAVSITGDITFTNAGVAALKNTGPGVTSATNANVTIDAQGRVTALSSGSGGGGTPAGSNTQVQFNNSGSFGANSDLTYAVAGSNAALTLGDNTTNTAQLILTAPTIPLLEFQSAVSTYLVRPVSGFGTVLMTLPNANWTGPTVVFTGATSQALVNNAVSLRSTAGAESFSAAPYKPGLYGDGADGATTTWTRPDLNATTLAVSATTGPTTYGRITIQCTSTAAFNASAVVNLNGLGYVGGGASKSTTVTIGQNGSGPGGGQGAFTSSASAGGGGGGGGSSLGGNGSITGTTGSGSWGGGSQNGFGVFDCGSGGGGGVTSLQAQTIGGNGGGYAKVAAEGAITTNASATLEADGGAGTAAASATTACGAGGGGGTWAFFSDTSINLAAGSVHCKGGAGGAATGATTGQGGGGGAGGAGFLESPSNTNSLVTATAFAGGAGGAAGTAGNPGAAGSTGTINLVNGKPNTPLISWLERNNGQGYKQVTAHLKRVDYPDANGALQDTHATLAALAAGDSTCPQIAYVCFMGGNANFGFGIDVHSRQGEHDKDRLRSTNPIA